MDWFERTHCNDTVRWVRSPWCRPSHKCPYLLQRFPATAAGYHLHLFSNFWPSLGSSQRVHLCFWKISGRQGDEYAWIPQGWNHLVWPIYGERPPNRFHGEGTRTRLHGVHPCVGNHMSWFHDIFAKLKHSQKSLRMRQRSHSSKLTCRLMDILSSGKFGQATQPEQADPRAAYRVTLWRKCCEKGQE